MSNPAIHGIGIDVVSPGGLEAAVGVGVDWSDRVAEGAPDVDVDVGVADDQSRVVAAPRAGDFGNAR